MRASLTALVLGLACSTAIATPLSGTVSSAEEGRMEGVVVSAQKAGSPITISVVSDAHGTYRFPVEKLGPGRYAIRIRAIGYDLKGPAEVAVASDKPDHLELRLVRTPDL